VPVVSARMELTNDFEVNLPVDQAWAVLTDVERIAPCLPGAELREVEGDEYRGVVKVKVGPITAEYKGKASFVELDPAVHHAVLRAQGRDTRGQGNASATIAATLEPKGSSTHVSVVTELTISGRVAQFGRGVLAEVSNKLMSEFVERLHDSLLSPVAAADGADPDAVPPEPGATEPGATETGSPGTGSTGTGSTENGSPETGTGRAGSNGAATTEDRASQDGVSQDGKGQDGKGQDGPGAEHAVRVVARTEAAPVDLVQVAGWPVLKKVLPATLGVAVLALLATWWLRKRPRSRG
jgi:uncharacterized protein